jgi:Transglycosylase SLT domain
MDKSIKTTNPASRGIDASVVIKPKPRRRRKPATRRVEGMQPVQRGSGKKSGKNVQNSQYSYKQKFMLVCIEIFCLGVIAVLAIMVLLGHSANRFSGTSFFGHLLPFAVTVLILTFISTILLIGWWKLRNRLQLHSRFFAPLLSISLALMFTWLAISDRFTFAYGNFRTLVGGKEEAGRVTIAHQVYAAYRRQNGAQLQVMIDRAQQYRQAIEDAARAFNIDAHLLYGIAATESSFVPRTSSDGGRGLFQITRVPDIAVAQARQRLGAKTISLDNPHYNAFVAAATFKHYLTEMKSDLFLGLLAYNIGPANGGLRFIMQQYGATDFTTVQPYLQTLPRDYPIRVLSYSLAFRIWEKEGRLLAYEEANNAVYIQRIGIPGLQARLQSEVTTIRD